MQDKPGGVVLLGKPVGHSLSPVMQNAAFRAAGLDLHYVARETAPEHLTEVMEDIRARRMAGNVTIPHKGAVAHVCDTLTPIAERVGAVNTFWVDDTTLCGDNTDVGGFDTAVRALIGEPPPRMRVTLIGAGGSALAVAAAIEQWNDVTLTVWNRTLERAASLARFFDGVCVQTDLARAVEHADLVINATPNGLADDIHPVDLTWLKPGAAVFDLVYKPGETAWVNAARTRGHSAADGIGMLIEQGALAFERWFGFPPDRRVMRHAIATATQTGPPTSAATFPSSATTP